MDVKQFAHMLRSLAELTPQQASRITHYLSSLQGLPELARHLEQVMEACPHCDSNHLIRWGRSRGIARFRCQDCRRTFSPLTNTPLAGLHYPERWIAYTETMIAGLSIRKSAHICTVHPNTAFRWRHRFLKTSSTAQARQLVGITEADETLFLRSEKGSRHLQRPARKRGGQASQNGRSKEHVCVMVARDRSGATADFIFPTFNAQELESLLKPRLAPDALLCSDGLHVYGKFCKKLQIPHRIIHSHNKQRVIQKVFHIQNVNAYHSRLKGWIFRFHGVATHYLANYLGWFRWLDQTGSATTPLALLLTARGVEQQALVT